MSLQKSASSGGKGIFAVVGTYKFCWQNLSDFFNASKARLYFILKKNIIMLLNKVQVWARIAAWVIKNFRFGSLRDLKFSPQEISFRIPLMHQIFILIIPLNFFYEPSNI